eukprot:CAMPEP_0176489452 /NCGR_PEP_ID=MMETSP0200_2-20121128/7295_1 /TAXON_ID=947934 /ORGANISM="Chaetoceros sp., Strain GSL56" /LENGTH=485 /DNA_ID=CAMNT_0017886593 /DNA_START=265 /DNA_END=1719 /DNA_ORIENTATION=+
MIIHWRGEKENGNSIQFRHKEFTSALLAKLSQHEQQKPSGQEQDHSSCGPRRLLKNVSFRPALSLDFHGAQDMSDYEKYAFENAMQYLDLSGGAANCDVTKDELVQTVQRCSLVRSLFEIIAQGNSYEELAMNALQSNRLLDLMDESGGANSDASASVSWRVRMRQYGGQAKTLNKQKQYGKKMRSPLQAEREAILQMGDLFKEFTGPVDLKNAHVSLYILEGLITTNTNTTTNINNKNDTTITTTTQSKVLARLVTRGAKTSIIAPKTRKCVTNTPLCPLAAFTMCNVARISANYKILDPFCGSCAILLAATMMEPSVQTVGIDIAHNGQVNRTDIMSDFSCRNLTLPMALIRGNSMLDSIRKESRAAIGNEPFDAIITDPPYGIREKSGYCVESPLIDLVNCIGKDRHVIDNNSDDCRLLKVGGRLIVFVPDHDPGDYDNDDGSGGSSDDDDDDDISKYLPSDEQLSYAGLEFVDKLKQPLND